MNNDLPTCDKEHTSPLGMVVMSEKKTGAAGIRFFLTRSVYISRTNNEPNRNIQTEQDTNAT